MDTAIHGMRVTVMGLGRFEGGVGVTRWLAGQGAKVLVTDRDPAEKLTASLAQVEPLGVTFRLGGHEERDFTDTDLVVVNPAVPDSSPFLNAARDAGVPITTEINLFVERCPARTIGITGSVGKSTTTAMIAHVLEGTIGRAGDSRIWVGGNIGASLLDRLPEIGESDWVVLELSSFQLERTPLVGWSPDVAVLTNLAPNHLDWHGSFEAYSAAKLNILRYQSGRRGAVVVGDHDELRRRVAGETQCDPSAAWTVGADEGGAYVRRAGNRIHWGDLKLAVPGRHNLENAAAAMAVSLICEAVEAEAMNALAGFSGLPHRLQRVATRDGVTYYNDSKSTTPEAAITAMSSIDAPLVMILGGYDKGSDLSSVSRLAARRARFAACVGKTGPTIAEQIRRESGRAEMFESFEAAVAACRSNARPGDVVLLSPACASWGMFEDYRQRGDLFTRLVQA